MQEGPLFLPVPSHPFSHLFPEVSLRPWWHEALHADAASPVAFRNLLHWLVERVPSEAGEVAPGR